MQPAHPILRAEAAAEAPASDPVAEGTPEPAVLLTAKGVISGLYWDNGKENGNYYLGFRVDVTVKRLF